MSPAPMAVAAKHLVFIRALAGAAGTYAKDARLAGHPVIGLIVGKRCPGRFSPTATEANRPIAFNDAGVLVHAMGKRVGRADHPAYR